MKHITCICLKYGDLYGPEYVNRLFDALKRNSSFEIRLWCMTDDPKGINPDISILPLPDEPFAVRMNKALETAPKRGRLKKVSLFRSGLIPDHQGPILVFDLDVAITGSIDDLYTFAPGKICMRREWQATIRKLSPGHGSVERFDPKLHPYLYDFMAREPEQAVAFGGGSEQAYTSKSALEAGDFEPYPDHWIASFKYDCRPPRPMNLFLEPRLPTGTKVVCFHGRPKMHEAVEGYQAGILHSTRSCKWLHEAWMPGYRKSYSGQ